jgi:ABC-2 type transport system ATP-binding protein
MNPTDIRIRTKGLCRTFGSNTALHPLDLEIGAGITGLLGPNGSGKSTFMRCLQGLVRPDSGEAWVDGVALTRDGVQVRRRVSYTPGEMHLYGEMRGQEHLTWFLRGRDAATHARGLELAQHLGLPLGHKVRGYSHGMKRQLCFAAALAPDVHVRILDEPTEGLDPTKRSQVLDLLAEDARDGNTILLSSHHLGEVDAVCDRILFLNAGQVIGDESAADVRLRAARMIRITWASPVLPESVRALQGPGVAEVSLDEDQGGRQATVHLDQDDPRAFLGSLATATLPPPTAIEHGKLSLQLLYRELYGVEGL